MWLRIAHSLVSEFEMNSQNRPVPEDFPRESPIAALSGAQPKVAARFDIASGRYVSGQTDAELAARFDICEDLAQQLVAKCQKNRSTKYSSLSEREILERLLRQLWGTGWGSDGEMAWVIRRTANVLGWDAPPLAKVPTSTPAAIRAGGQD